MTIRYQVDDLLTIAIPDDWDVLEPSDGASFVALAPEAGSDGIQPYIAIDLDESDDWDSSEAYFVGNLVSLRQDTRGYVEKVTFRYEVDDHQVYCVEFNALTDEGIFTFKQYFVVVGTSAYLITCKMPPELVEEWSDVFESVVESIEIRKET